MVIVGLSSGLQRNHALRLLNQFMPALPENAQLVFVDRRGLGLLHATGNVVPSGFLRVRVSALARLEHLDIVRSRKPSGAEKLQEAVQPVLAEPVVLFRWTDGPRRNLHVVRLPRIEGPEGERHYIDDHEIGEDQQVAAVLRDTHRTFLTVPGDEALHDAVYFRFALVTPRRNPV